MKAVHFTYVPARGSNLCNVLEQVGATHAPLFPPQWVNMVCLHRSAQECRLCALEEPDFHYVTMSQQQKSLRKAYCHMQGSSDLEEAQGGFHPLSALGQYLHRCCLDFEDLTLEVRHCVFTAACFTDTVNALLCFRAFDKGHTSSCGPHRCGPTKSDESVRCAEELCMLWHAYTAACSQKRRAVLLCIASGCAHATSK